MTNHLLIGAGSGLVTALLYSSVMTLSPLSMMLFYLAPLPLFIAGLGWGAYAAAAGALAGTLAISVVLGLITGLLFLVSEALPPVVLSYLALLSRPIPAGANGADGPGEQREWYPPGRLLVWIAAIGGVLVALPILFFGPTADQFEQNVRALFNRLIDAQPALRESLEQSGANGIDRVIDTFIVMVLPVSATLWVLATLLNIWLASKVLAMSGRPPRPWPPFRELVLPPKAAIAFLVAVICVFLGGTIGLIAGIFATTFGLALALLGLAVIHFLVADTPSRTPLLAGVYFAIFVFSWLTVAALASVGLAELVL